MRLWRLSADRHARDLSGGYGLINDGRWNTRGRPLTYTATTPSLCALEKLVHVEDPGLLPALAMVEYNVPDRLGIEIIELGVLPADWRARQTLTQQLGDHWHDSLTSPLLRIPSVIMPSPDLPDRNLMINHRHPDAGDIAITAITPFSLDSRLFKGTGKGLTAAP